MTLVRHFYPAAWTGYDRDGRPILFLRFNRADFPGMLREASLAALVKRNVEMYENALKCYPGKQFVVVIDINTATFINTSKFSWIAALKEFLGGLSKLEAYYPETIHRICFVNQPWLFGTVWAVVKHFFAKDTIDKVRILGEDRSKLFALVPPKALPKYVDGTSQVSFARGGSIDEGVRAEYAKKCAVPAVAANVTVSVTSGT